MHKKNISIVVVIPTFNRKKHLKILLNQLYKQNLENCKIEIVIVGDGSIDGTYEMLSNYFTGVHVVKGTGNWWFTKSLNKGCIYAKKFNPDYVLILNDDTEINSNYISNIISEHKKLNKNAVLGSISISKTTHCITYVGTRKIIWWRAKRYSYPLNQEKNNLTRNSLYPSQTLTARGTLIPYSILEYLNYFDEKKFPQYGSDDDFALKANKKGIPVYISSKCQVIDNTESTSGAAPRLSQKISVFLLNLFNKHSPVYLLCNIRLAWRYGKIFTFPLSIIFIILGTFYRFFKYKFSSNNIYLNNRS